MGGLLKIIAGPNVVEKFHDVTILSGDKLELSAKVSGVPNPEVSWFMNDRPIVQDKSNSLQNVGEQFSFMKESCSPDDDGVYKMNAVNAGGSVDISAKVTVLQAPKK